MQRMGRVGRVRDGIYIKFSNGKENKSTSLPEIETTDLSSAILYLREYDYHLEKIDNLPDEISPVKLIDAMNILKKCKALEDDHLSDKGIEILKLSPLTPFIASAIIDLSNDTNIIKFPLENKPIYIKLFSSFVILVANDQNLVIDPQNKMLKKNYNTSSDLMTVIATIFDLTKDKGGIKELAPKYGFNPKSIKNILGTIKDFAKRFGLNYEDGDKNTRSEIWDKLEKIYYKCNFMGRFSKSLIDKISKNNPAWLEYHTGSFYSLYDVNNEPKILFEMSLQTDAFKIDKNTIKCDFRIGCSAADIPQECFIWNVRESNNSYYGQYIQSKTQERINIANIPIDTYLHNLLTFPLLEILSSNSNIRNNVKSKYFGKKEEIHTKIFYTQSIDPLQYSINFVPLNDASYEITVNEVKEKIEELKLLLPLISSSIIREFKNKDQICLITGDSTENFSAQFCKKSRFHYCKLDSLSIKYLLNNLVEVNKSIFVFETLTNRLIIATEEKLDAANECPEMVLPEITIPELHITEKAPRQFDLPLYIPVMSAIERNYSKVTCIGKGTFNGNEFKINKNTINDFAETVLAHDIIRKPFKISLTKVCYPDEEKNAANQLTISKVTVICPDIYIPRPIFDEDDEEIPVDHPTPDNKFLIAIKKVNEMFGQLIQSCEIEIYQAEITIVSQFAAAYVNHIDFELLNKQGSAFTEYIKDVPPLLKDNPITHFILRKWIDSHSLDIRVNNNRYFGTFGTMLLTNYFYKTEPPDFRYKIYYFDVRHNVEKIRNEINLYNIGKSPDQQIYMYEDEYTIVSSIFTPMLELERFIKPADQFSCICNCNKPELSSFNLNSYDSEESIICKPFCKNCLRKMIHL